MSVRHTPGYSCLQRCDKNPEPEVLQRLPELSVSLKQEGEVSMDKFCQSYQDSQAREQLQVRLTGQGKKINCATVQEQQAKHPARVAERVYNTSFLSLTLSRTQFQQRSGESPPGGGAVTPRAWQVWHVPCEWKASSFWLSCKLFSVTEFPLKTSQFELSFSPGRKDQGASGT